MKKVKLTRSLMAAVSVVALSAVMYGCVHSGDGDDSTPAVEMPDPPTDYEAGEAAIMAAETAEAAQEAYDAVDQDAISGAEAASLKMALDNKLDMLATAGREADQKMALSDAAGMIDTSDEALSTQEGVNAARAAIATLRDAIAAAVDVDDTSMYQTVLSNAETAVDEAQGGIDTATRRTNQMSALSDAAGDLKDAITALSGVTPTQALLDDANEALDALKAAIAGGMDLTDTEKAPYQLAADNADAPINAAQMAFDDAEKKAEEDERMAEEERQRMADAAMAVTAKKLYTGIGAPNATGSDAAQRQAAYSGTDDVDITVTWGAADTAQALTVDDDATVAARHGWEGMKFTAEPDGDAGTYEAVVYSHVGDPTEGAMFSATYSYDVTPATTGGTDFTELSMAGANLVASRVASSSFDQSAGTKEFELGTNMRRVMIAGSYHGVPGTYSCTPAASSTCAVQVADGGFDLGGTADADNAFTAGGGTWTFKATDADTRLMETPDNTYASYGWWLHKSEDGETFIASAFTDYRGTAPTVEIAALRGTATYTGGAAGKYSLRGSTGGTNDAGHFTADAMLEATFADDHTISGTIDNFMGADGMSRDWSVALAKSRIGDNGAIAGDPDTVGDTNAQKTTWTIGEIAGDADGMWSGMLHEEGDDGVPGIATGTFYSTYGQNGNDGKLVGAFGANE